MRAAPSRCCSTGPTGEDLDRVAALAEEIGLADEMQRKSGELSHGQKQWLEIGMLLAQEPRLLLVDEPAAGMTPAEREHTTRILVEAAQTRAVVVVEHDMEFIRRLDCRVTVAVGHPRIKSNCSRNWNRFKFNCLLHPLQTIMLYFYPALVVCKWHIKI